MPKRGSGEGTIERLPSGKFRASRSAGKVEGRYVRERRTFDRRADAQTWLRKMAEEKRGEWARRTLAEWLDKWLEDKAGEVEPATIKWYKDRVDRRIRGGLGQVQLGELTPMQVRDWMSTMTTAGVSSRDRHGALKTLRTALQSAINAGQLYRNVAKEGSKLPKLKARAFTVWTDDQALAFLAATAGSDIEAYWWLALDTGCRPGELFGLHWPCVNPTAGTVEIRQALEWISKRTPRLKEPKTEAGIRTLPVTDATMKRLQAHRQKMREKGYDVNDGPVFLNRWGTWLRPKETGDRLRKLCKAAGVPRIRLYDLRHTSATLLLAGDVNIKVVSQRLGHTDIAITLRHYAGFLPSMQERAVKAMETLHARLPTVVANGSVQSSTSEHTEAKIG